MVVPSSDTVDSRIACLETVRPVGPASRVLLDRKGLPRLGLPDVHLVPRDR